MKIYRVEVDGANFQSFLPEDTAIWSTGHLFMDCSPKLPSWIPPRVYVLQPKLKRGNFFGLGPGMFVADSIAVGELRDLFEMSGELLPLTFDGHEYYAVNVLGCFELLDQSSTQWEKNKAGVNIRVVKYGFQSSRFPEVPLLKIPQTCRGEILACDGLDAHINFKKRVEEKGLTGLRFKEIWTD